MELGEVEDDVRKAVYDFAQGLRTRDARVSMTHMTTNMAGVTRLCTVTNALMSLLHDLKIGVWFLVHHEAEIHSISNLDKFAADIGEVFTFTEPEVGKIFITTFTASRQTFAMRGTKESPLETQLVIMDLGIGLQSAETALAARSWMEFVLEDSVLKNHHPPMTYALLSISTSHGPVDEAIIKPYAQAVQGWDPVIREFSVEYPNARWEMLPAKDWANVIKDKVVTAWQSTPKGKEAQGMSYLCLMSSYQVYALADAIQKEADDIPVEPCFIHPWTDEATLTTLGRSSNKLRLIYVSKELTYIPCVEDLQEILIGNAMDHFIMDANISTVVQTCLTVSPTVVTLAGALQDSQLHSRDIKIYQCVDIEELDSIPEQPKDTRDLMYMIFKMTQVIGPQTVACLNSSSSHLPVDCLQYQSEAAKRLVVLGFNDFPNAGLPNVSPEVLDLLRITEMAKGSNLDGIDLATDQGNKLNVLVLLSCIKDSMSHKVRRIIIELAVLVWMNPSTLLIPFKHRPTSLRIVLYLLNKSKFLKPYIYEGQLWFALAWLWVYERLLDGKIPSSSNTTTFMSATNIPAIERVMRQKKVWMKVFQVQEAALPTSGELQLSMDEFLQVEKSLVRAFCFNIMLVVGNSHGTPPPYFGRDVMSQVVLQAPVQDTICDDLIDWQRIFVTRTEVGLFAIYSHLQRTPDQERGFTYAPRNVTVVSNAAVQAVIADLVPVGCSWSEVMRPLLEAPRSLRM